LQENSENVFSPHLTNVSTLGLPCATRNAHCGSYVLLLS